MELTEILTKEEWAAFEKELFDRFQINCTVYNTDGIGVTGKPNWCNRLCPEIKGNQESLAAICAPGNQNFMARAEKTRQPVIDECDAGLVKIAVPIFNQDEFLGTAGGCGRLPEAGEVDAFIVQKTTGLDESAVNKLCESVATITRSEAQAVADYIEKRIGEFVAGFEERGRVMA